MFGNVHLERLRQAFADQFSRDEHGFVYRRYQKGAPVRVSTAERDAFVAAFNKRMRYAIWSIVPLTVALIVLLAWLAPDDDSPAGQIAMWAGLAAIVALFVAMHYSAWNAPSRALQRRTPEGPALTKDEARSLAWSKITYGQLALVAAMGVGLTWRMSARMDVSHGWGMIWLVIGAGLVVLAGVQAIRKWRHGQR